MPVCTRCQGEGYETFEEDDRMVQDACYHCCASGQVDEETHFHDQLMSVAYGLAYDQECDYRKGIDEDPDGDGYDLHAAENMMRPFEYFMSRVYDRQYQIAEQLAEMNLPSQQLLIAWHEQPRESLVVKSNQAIQQELTQKVSSLEDEEIPF